MSIVIIITIITTTATSIIIIISSIISIIIMNLGPQVDLRARNRPLPKAISLAAKPTQKPEYRV